MQLIPLSVIIECSVTKYTGNKFRNYKRKVKVVFRIEKTWLMISIRDGLP